MSEYRDALIAVKGIGPQTADELMGKYPTADVLKAALADGSYDGPFPDELAAELANFEETPQAPDVDEEEEAAPAPAPKSKAKKPEKKVKVMNRSMQEAKLSTAKCSVLIRPGRTLAVPASVTKTKQFNEYVKRRWLVIVE